MKKTLKFLVALSVLAFVQVSCSTDDPDEEEHNHVTITIENPTDGATISATDAENLEVKIKLEADVELHDVEILLHPSGDESDKILEADVHEHDKSHTYTQTVDLSSYPAGTSFHLEVEACEDHDCAEKATADVTFSLE